jgi:tetratricopeptide (TPR) repeat protein
LIKISTGNPLFTSQEASKVIQTVEGEGVDKNEYQSGTYKLGGDRLVNLPETRSWFNEKLQSTFFPLVTDLFPKIVSSTSELRAHSVSLLKYSSSHPRTNEHIDNGILAMTPQDDYVGGGTFFEHMEEPLEMDVGHITVRPGSVRHGGHKVTKGTRYILGAFLLIKDRVEHVRRLKNRGSKFRRKQDLYNAAKHFEWALAINPKCTTCLKDWAEIIMTQKKYIQAELKIREALRLLENRDSDALFSLDVILSEAGKDEESIIAYTQSVELNAEDSELCYNLGIKLGDKGEKTGKMTMYARATQGGAWLN